jgi:arylformamidase
VVCIDVRDGFKLNDVKAIPADVKAVLFYTGFDAYYDQPKYWTDYPVMGDDVIDELIKRGVSLIGLDCAGPDLDEKFPVHIRLLGADILIVENLTGLDKLVGKGICEFHAVPLRLPLDGSPVRAFAVLKGGAALKYGLLKGKIRYEEADLVGIDPDIQKMFYGDDWDKI